jgi:hypothetical protein
MDEVIRLEASQTRTLADVLSRAFYAEPRFTYMVPDEAERRSILPRLLTSVIEVSQLHGESYTTPALEGGSVWIRPDHASVFQRVVWARLQSMDLTFSVSSFRRSLRLSTRLEQVRRQLARIPHWYLVAFGLEPGKTREAIRDALIQPGLSRADSEQTHCYVETLQERDLAFYGEHGFRIEGSGRISPTGPKFWAMIRGPASITNEERS